MGAPGLASEAMMVYKRGSVWWYEFTIRGQRIRESSHSKSKTIAQRAEDQRRRALEESINGLSKCAKPLLFNAAGKDYLTLKAPRWSESTLRIETQNVEHLKGHFGGTLLVDITAADIAEYQQKRQDVGAAGATVNMEVDTLRAMLRRHRLWANLQADVERLDERDDVGKALTLEEETALLAACQASRSRALYPAVALALNTGLRRAELLSLRWSQVDLVKHAIKVGASKTRAGRGRIVPLNATAIRVLTDWAEQFSTREPTHAVFPTEHVGASGDAFAVQVSGTEPETPIGSLKTSWKTAKRLAGVEARWHDLRHSACTRLVEKGVPLPVIGRIFGWSTSTLVRMVQRYGHVSQEAQRAAMANLDRTVVAATTTGVATVTTPMATTVTVH